MSYLEALESQLTTTDIPARRRRRILAEFADHVHENPSYDGIARGLLDAAACMIGFSALGGYLGLRTATG